MVLHSSTLAWKIPWMEEPGSLQSTGSWRVRHDWVTSLSLFTFMHWKRKWQPTPVFLPGESQGRESLEAAIYGVIQSRTRLKWLSSSSSSSSRVVNWPGFNTLASQVLGEVLRRDERWEKSCWWNRQHTHNIYPWSVFFHLGVICSIPKQLKWYHQRSQITITI